MMIRILYFAGLREALDCAEEALDLQGSIATVGDLRRHLSARGGAWRALDSTRNLRFAVNHAMATDDAGLGDGDEVAFFPPVTGG